MEASETPQLPISDGHAEDEGIVRVLDDRLVIEKLTVTDERAAQLVRNRRELGQAPARTLNDAIEVGARVLDREEAAAEVDFVRREYERAVAEHRRESERQQREAVERIESEIRRAFGDGDASGLLVQALEHHHRELGELIEQNFDEGSEEAIPRRIQELIEQRNREFLERLSANDELNPLRPLLSQFSTWVRERREAQDERDQKLEGKLDEFLTRAAELTGLDRAREALAEAEEAGTRKGRTFEERVHTLVETVAAAKGDAAHHVGDVNAESGGKKGDTVSEIGGGEGPPVGRIAVEAKTDRGLTRPQAWRELNGAIDARDAGYAVLVVAGEDAIPSNTKPWLEYEGNKMIVAVDHDDPEPIVIEAAYTIARSRVLAQAERDLRVDAAGVRDAVCQALEDLRQVATVRKHLTGVERSTGNAKEAVAALEERLRTHLGRIDELVSVVEPEVAD